MAQSANNYAFSTNTSGSFVPMDGSRAVFGGGANLASSGIFNFGFDTWFMGERFTQFSMNTNGVIRFGPIQLIKEANSYLIDFQSRLVPFASTTVQQQGSLTVYTGAWRVWARGQIHQKVVGTAPDRVLVIECRDMSIGEGSTTPDATWQILVSESFPGSADGGRIEYRYGPMTSTLVDNNIQIGLGSGSSAGLHAGVRLGEPPRREPNGVSNSVPRGNIPILHSPTEGNRRVMVFNPPAPNGQATDLRASCNTGTRVELTWANTVGNAVGSVLYRSTDNVNFAFHSFIKKADGNRRVEENLQVGTTYYYHVHAVTEGKLSVLHPTGSIVIRPGIPQTAPIKRTLCGAGNLTLDPGAGYAAYKWASGETTQTISVPAPTSGEVVYIVEVADACGNAFPVEFTLQALTLVIGGKRLFCPGEQSTTRLQGSLGFAAYRWTNGQGQVVGTGSSLEVAISGSYQLEVTSAGGCSAKATAEVQACCEGSINIPSAFTPHNTPDNNVFRVAHQGLSNFKMQIYNRWGILVYETTDPEQGWDGLINGQKAAASAYQVVVEFVGCIEGNTRRRRQTGVLHLLE